jgi:hypothetical protein
MFRRVMDMSQYNVRLTDEERGEPRKLTRKGGKSCRIKLERVLFKPDKVPGNAGWTYERKGAENSAATASTAERLILKGLKPRWEGRHKKTVVES